MKHIIYMAAGNSRRFGQNKLLYELKGRPVYQYGLLTLLKVLAEHPDCTLTIVTRYQEILAGCAEQIRLRLGPKDAERCQLIDSPESADGVAYTIRNGIRAVCERFLDRGDIEEELLIFVTADQPGLSADTVSRLLAAEVSACASVCYGDRPGSPTLFRGSLIPELLELTGDQGGRRVLARHDCLMVPAAREEELLDLDLPEDLSFFLKYMEEAKWNNYSAREAAVPQNWEQECLQEY